MTAVLSEMERSWRPQCEQRQVLLIVSVPASPLFVAADVRRLRQVLDGLASNALRQLAPGQRLVFACSLLPDGAAAIEIRDSGPGLAVEDYAVMFQPGVLHERYRQSRPGGGAGLGLALAHGLVLRMGGPISAGPAPEGGVRCVLTFRSVPPPVAVQAREPNAVHSVAQ